MEGFYMALADKTRLRILNLIRDGEVCVLDFTEALGDSQPKISRHLAYLRSAGVVEARRDGKWMYYSIRRPESRGARAVLQAALAWLASDERIPSEAGRRPAAAKLVPEADPKSHIQRSSTGPVEPVRLERPHHNELEEFLL